MLCCGVTLSLLFQRETEGVRIKNQGVIQYRKEKRRKKRCRVGRGGMPKAGRGEEGLVHSLIRVLGSVFSCSQSLELLFPIPFAFRATAYSPSYHRTHTYVPIP